MSLADALGPSPPWQDFIGLAGLPSPGLAVVRGAGSPRNWDVRQGYGLTGASLVFTGQGLAEFEVDIFCWETFHFALWQTFARATLVNPPLGTRPTSMSIQHPALNDPPLSITQVVVKDVSQWEQESDGGGMWVRTIKFQEFRAPRPALVKPLEGPPGSPVAVKPPANPEEAQIAALSADIAAAGGL